ncbi:hypothetical protein PMAYCL1PPCAC_19915, partial [Pristionchus mayeri]
SPTFPFLNLLESPKMLWKAAAFAVVVGLASAASLPEHRHIPECPNGARPLLRPDGQPRKCLPHQNNLCVNALPDKPDAETVCCYHNQVDYFCCLDATEEQCPDYEQVTVVIHNSLPHDPFALRSYFFKEGIEDQLVEEAFAKQKDAPTNEDGFLVRRQL